MRSPADRALHGAPDRAVHSAADGRGLELGRQLRTDPAFREAFAREHGPTDEDCFARADRALFERRSAK